jgi:hypothetical protein
MQSSVITIPETPRSNKTSLFAAHEILDLRRLDWVVYTKRPFAGPEQVLS